MTPVRSPAAGPAVPAGPAAGAPGPSGTGSDHTASARTAQPVALAGASAAVNDSGARPVALPGGGAVARRTGGRAAGGAGKVILVAAVAGAALAGGLATLVTAGGSGGTPTVEIRAFHSRFEPDRVTVRPGETVRFVITNVDPIDHEFIIGPPETHDIHERGEPHFHTGAVPGEVTVPAGATVETTWTFGPSGSPDVAYGCHLAGHWSYGMHGKALIR